MQVTVVVDGMVVEGNVVVWSGGSSLSRDSGSSYVSGRTHSSNWHHASKVDIKIGQLQQYITGLLFHIS